MAKLPVCLGVEGGAATAPDPVGVAGVGVGGAARFVDTVVVDVGVTTTLIIVSSSKMLGVGGAIVGGGAAVIRLFRLLRAFFFCSAAARTVEPVTGN
jgi:7-keto-8-aminopelargonate synthetase-like enzyme